MVASQQGPCPEGGALTRGENPYAGFGGVVRGERLVGRQSTLKRMREMFAGGRGSLAIIGEPRIGKSSLAQALREWVESKGDAVVLVEINLSADLEPGMDMISAVGRELELGSEPGDSERLYDGYRLLKQHLRAAKKGGRHHTLILDEFDAVREMAHAQISLRRLRELLSKPHEYGLSAVLVSRRRIASLERQISDLSTLDGVCPSLLIRPLSHQGICDMVSRGWPLESESTALAEQVLQHTGGHPFLSEALLFELFEGSSVEDAVSQSAGVFRSYFIHLTNILSEDGLLETALRLANDQTVPASEEFAALIEYGVVKRPGMQSSDHELWAPSFKSYLKLLPRNEQPWPTDV